MMDQDELLEILNAEGLAPELLRPADSFKSYIKFMVDDLPYFIEWWSDISYLSIGGRYNAYIMFTEMKVNVTWPSFVRGLEFKIGAQRVALVATKKLDWQEV